jgi:succinoglycan biosynthesis transport protein ExoP
MVPLERTPIDRRFEEVGRTDFDGGPTIRSMIEVLNRRKLVTLACVIIGTLLAVVSGSLLPKRYIAESIVILKVHEPEIFQRSLMQSSLVSGSTSDTAVVRSEVALLSSPAYARKIIEQLDLLHDPNFLADAGNGTETIWQRGVGTIRGALDRIGLERLASTLLPPAAPAIDVPQVVPEEMLMGNAIGVFSRHLTIAYDDRSYAIGLRYESRNPVFAARVVNALANRYIMDQLHSKQDSARAALVWLKKETESLGKRVFAADQEVAQFENQHQLASVVGSSIAEQKLAELSAQLSAATANRVRLESELAQFRDSPDDGTRYADASEVLTSPLIQSLRQRKAEAEDAVASLRQTYGPAHPNVATAESRLRQITRSISVEVNRVASSLNEEINAARLRERNLQQRVMQLRGQLDAMNTDRVQLRELQRKASVGRNLYESLLERAEQVESEAQSQQADARMVPAEIPIYPSFPNRKLLGGLGFIGSLMLGLWLAFAIDRMDETVRTPEDAERATQVPILGIVPHVGKGERAISAMVERPRSTYSEAIANILVALRIAGRHGGCRVIAIASAMPNEGKTLLATSLARSAAARGIRTLLIDCDMRRPAVARLLGKRGKSLNAMFADHSAGFTQVATDTPSGLHYVWTTKFSGNPQEVLGSPWMAKLIAKARDDYEFVVLDTPPLLAVSDTLLLSRLADVTLMSVRWGQTLRRTVREAIRSLELYGTHPLGVILSMVHLRKYRRYRTVGYHSPNTTSRRLITWDAY